MSRHLGIILADDDTKTRDVLEDWLTDLGHEVRGAGGGWSLVNECQDSLPDLVISEALLPDLDGLTAVRMILRGGPVPVILMSAQWDEATASRAAALGVTCLDKPLNPLTLINAVETACRDILADPNRLEPNDSSTRLQLSFGT
jgi:DNA-binding response OmpR family regulator